MKKTVSLLLALFLLLAAFTGCQKAKQPADSSESDPIRTKEYQMPSHMSLRYKDFGEAKILKIDVRYDGRTMTVLREDGAELTVEYDEQGRLVKEILYDVGGTFNTHNEYTYGDDGKLLRKTVRYKSGDVNYLVDYTYDEKGNLLLSERRHEDDGFYGRTEYTYSSGGVLLQILTYSGGTLTGKDTFDENGKPTETLYYDSNGEVSGHVEYVYSETGVPAEETHYVGERITSSLSYDENGTLIKDVSYAYGGYVEKETLYDGHGNEIRHTEYNWDGSIREGLSYSCAYVYDENGSMTECIRYDASDVLQWTEQYEYDGNGTLRKERWLNENGEVTGLSEYDENGVKIRSQSVGYTLDGERVELSHTYSYTYNENGDPLEELEIDSDGEVTQRKKWTYDKNGNLLTHLDDLGSICTREEYKYDENGRKIEYEYSHERLFSGPYHYRTTYAYDADGNLSEVVEYQEEDYGWVIREETVYSDYDANGNCTLEQKRYYSATFPVHARTENTYDEAGNLLSCLIYDPFGNLVEKETYQYDAKGRETVLETYDAGWYGASYRYESTYDEKGLQTKRGYYGSMVLASLQEYDESGNETLAIYYEDAGETVSSVTENVYDETGRLIKTTRYEGDRKKVTYSHESVFDEADRLVKEITFENHYFERYEVTLYEYDENGHMSLQTAYHTKEEPGDLEGVQWAERRWYTHDGDGCLQTEERAYDGGMVDYKYNVTESTTVTLTEAQYEEFLARIGEFLSELE